MPRPWMDFPDGSLVKNLPANAGDVGLVPGSGKSPGEGNGYPVQYSCLENSRDRGAWWATVHGVAKSQTRLTDRTIPKTMDAVQVQSRGPNLYLGGRDRGGGGGGGWASTQRQCP